MAFVIRHDGSPELLDLWGAADESEATLNGLSCDLKQRELAEANRWVERLEARITEGDAGLGAALALNYAETPHQKSVFRKVKNLLEDLQDKTLQGGHPHGSRGDIQGQT